MFSEVQRVLNNTLLSEDELTSSAAYLLKKQFVFRDFSGDKKHFQIIESNMQLYRNAFAFFGAELIKDADNGYIGYLPKQSLGNLKLVETYCLLTLRLIYDQEKLTGLNETNDGSVLISGERVVLEYKKNTNRDDLDKHSTFLAHLKPLRQKSLIRFGNKNPETDIEDIYILPTIEVVVDEAYAKTLIAALNKEAPTEETVTEDETDATD